MRYIWRYLRNRQMLFSQLRCGPAMLDSQLNSGAAPHDLASNQVMTRSSSRGFEFMHAERCNQFWEENVCLNCISFCGDFPLAKTVRGCLPAEVFYFACGGEQKTQSNCVSRGNTMVISTHFSRAKQLVGWCRRMWWFGVTAVGVDSVVWATIKREVR